jgi:hypothetical protein
MLNLSQVWDFDRPNINIIDDRAPRVRNRIGWVVQVMSSSRPHSCCSVWNAGMSWQFNRFVAIKTVFEQQSVHPTQQQHQQQQHNSETHSFGSALPTSACTTASLRTALILKRWAQPCGVLSLQHRYDFASPGGQSSSSTTIRGSSYFGFGLEIEPSYSNQ